MKKIIFAMTFFLLATNTFAAVLTFDDITDQVIGNIAVPNGYGGFRWAFNSQTGLGYYHKDYATSTYPDANYANGISSGNYATYNLHGGTLIIEGSMPGADLGQDSYTLFDFHGAYLTSSWHDGNILTVNGYLDNVQKYQALIQLDILPARYFSLNFLGIDTLVFSSSNGQFVMDDFMYSVEVLEPSTLVLLVLGLAGLGGIAMRRYRCSFTIS